MYVVRFHGRSGSEARTRLRMEGASTITISKTDFAKMIKQVQAPKQFQASKQVQRIPYVAAKAAVVKSTQVVTKVKDGITEVRDMFQKVDNAFKKRKEDSQVLAMAISDAESHLAYLESQTQEQIRSTSALGLALSSRQEQICSVSKAVENFEFEGLENFRSLFDELKMSTEQVSGVGLELKNEVTILTAHLSEQSRFVESVESALQEYAVQDTAEEKKLASLVAQIEAQEIERKNAEERLKHAQVAESNLDVAISGSREELPRKRDKLQGLKKSYIEKQAISQRLQVRASQLNDDIAALQTTTEKHLVAFETQHALRLEEIAALAVTFQESRANRDAKYQELQALQMQKGQLDSDVTAAEAALDTLSALLREEQKTQEALKAEVELLDSTVQQARAELDAAHHTAAQATKDNEEQYQMTCARMTALREAHHLQSTLSQNKHTLEEKLNARVRDLQATLTGKEADAEKEQQLLQEDEAQLTAACKRVVDVQEDLNRLRLLCTDQQKKRRATSVEQANLTALRDDLTSQVAVQKELELRQASLEEARAEQRISLSSAADMLRAQQQELEVLERSISEAKAAQKKKQTNATPTALQQQLHEAEVEQAIGVVSVELNAKHATEIADLEDCRAQLARGFPEQKERAAKEVQTKTAEVANQRQSLQDTQQSIQHVKEQLQRQAEEKHLCRVTFLQQHRSLPQLQALHRHLQTQLTSVPAPNTTTRHTTQLQRTLAAVSEALVHVEAVALQREQELERADVLGRAQAEAEREAAAAAEADALATARANELANAAIHSDDVFPFDLADEINIMGPPSSSLEPHLRMVEGIALDINTPAAATTTTTHYTYRSMSTVTSAFQSPVDTFPVPYAVSNEVGTYVDTTAVTHVDAIAPSVAPEPLQKTKAKQTTKTARNKRKGTQQSSVPLPRSPSPEPPTPVITATPIADGLTRWERSQPTASHQLPLPPPPSSLTLTTLPTLSAVPLLPGPPSSQTQQQQPHSASRQPSTHGIRAALSPAATETSATASMDLFDDLSVAHRRAPTVTTTVRQSQAAETHLHTTNTATAIPTTTVANSNTHNAGTISSISSTPEEERAARRREKNKIHKQKQKERNKARTTTTATTATVTATVVTAVPAHTARDDASVQSEDQSWDLLRAYPPPPPPAKHTTLARDTSSNRLNDRATSTAQPAATAAPSDNTGALTHRPPLHKGTTHTTSAAPSTTNAANSATRTSGTSGSSSRVRSGSNNSWDIFGLPPVATLPPPINSSKKYASKNSSSARPTGVLNIPADTDEDGVNETTLTATAANTATGAASATTANKNAITVPIVRRPTTNTTNTTAVHTLPDKRKYGQISNGIATSTTSTAAFVVPSGQPSDKHRKANRASTATIPTTTTSTMHSTNATNSTSVREPIAGARPTTTHSVRAAASSTATLTATSGAATVLNKKKNKSVVSKDWFDEDAPF